MDHESDLLGREFEAAARWLATVIPLHAGIEAHLVAPVAWHATCDHHQADITTFS
jgi:hypothetical protein